MLDKLFNSKVRVAVLGLFFENEDKSFYVQEIIKKTGGNAANTHRELGNLEGLGVLKSEVRGNQKYFFLNKKNQFFEPLKALIRVYKGGTDAWFLMEELPNGTPMYLSGIVSNRQVRSIIRDLKFASTLSKGLIIYQNKRALIHFIKSEFDVFCNEVVDAFVRDPKWASKVDRTITKESARLFEHSNRIAKMNLSKLTNSELAKAFSDYYEQFEKTNRYAWIQVALDYGDNVFSKYMLDYLKERTSSKKGHIQVGDVFSKLTTPVRQTFAQREYEALLKILRYIAGRESLKKYFATTETRIIVKSLEQKDKKLFDMLEAHVSDFGWLGYGLIGPGWGPAYFIDILSSLVKQKLDPKKILDDLAAERQELARAHQDIERKLQIDKKHSQIFELARDFVYSKAYRKDALFHYFQTQEYIFREIGKRYYLSVNQVRFLYPHEIKNLLLGKKFDFSILNERQRYSLHYSADGGDYTNDKILVAEQAKKFVDTQRFIKEDLSNIKQLNGDCASPGKARGKCVIIDVVEDMKKMQKGNILISIATNPDLVPAIKQAAAIITDMGGITCHAAIISRELGIPCVIGTKHATKVLRDGDMVEVDATHGKVRVIEKAKR